MIRLQLGERSRRVTDPNVPAVFEDVDEEAVLKFVSFTKGATFYVNIYRISMTSAAFESSNMT